MVATPSATSATRAAVARNARSHATAPSAISGREVIVFRVRREHDDERDEPTDDDER